MVKKLIYQLTALLLIASLIGVILLYFGVPIIYGLLLGIIIQIGLNYCFLTCLDAFVALKNKKLENERIREFSLQGMEVTCPCSLKKTEFVPITLNTANSYKCNYCQKNVSVYVIPETALITETIASTINLPTQITEQFKDGNS